MISYWCPVADHTGAAEGDQETAEEDQQLGQPQAAQRQLGG